MNIYLQSKTHKQFENMTLNFNNILNITVITAGKKISGGIILSGICDFVLLLPPRKNIFRKVLF